MKHHLEIAKKQWILAGAATAGLLLSPTVLA